MHFGRRLFLAVATLGIGVAATTPSVAATHDPVVPWASLGVVHPLLVQSAGFDSPIAAQPTKRTFGWCTTNGVEISTDGGHATFISNKSVGRMLERAHMGLPTLTKRSPIVATCDDLALDPNHPKTVFAGFEASQNGTSIPPVYDVALVTSNAGRSWRFVPAPRGDSARDFSGFIERASGVELLYSRNIFFPLMSERSTTFVAVTSSNGGKSWSVGQLGCSADTPCVIFGPQAPATGGCGMSEWKQSVLLGFVGEGAVTTRWRPAGSVSTVNQCGGQQLIATRSGDAFLIDRSRPHALNFTRDGLHWTAVALPKIDGAGLGSRFAGFGQVMTLDADGALVAVDPSTMTEHLEILEPRTNSWCAASVTLPKATRQNPVVAIQSSKTRLVVAFSSAIKVRSQRKAMAESFPLSMLRCRS